MTPLRQRMMEDMQIRKFSPQTIEGYLPYVAQFAKHFNQSPDLLGTDEIRQYQVFLPQEKKVAGSNLNLARSTLRFLYKATLGSGLWSTCGIPHERGAAYVTVLLKSCTEDRGITVCVVLESRPVKGAGRKQPPAGRGNPSFCDAQREEAGGQRMGSSTTAHTDAPYLLAGLVIDVSG